MFQLMGPLFLYFFQNFANFRFRVNVRGSVRGSVRVRGLYRFTFRFTMFLRRLTALSSCVTVMLQVAY